MKRIITLLVCAGLGIGVYLVLHSPGCQARMVVAKEQLANRIDTMIGRLEVQRKQIEISMQAMKQGLDGMTKAKVKAQVRRDQLQDKVEPVTRRLAAIDVTLLRLRDCLASKGPVEIGGKTYTQPQLKEMADGVLATRRELVGQAEGLQKVKGQIQAVFDCMQRKQAEYERRLGTFQAQVTQIDSKLIAVNAMKEASKSMEGSDKTFAENVARLEDQIAELHSSVEAELRCEDEKWSESEAAKQIDAVGAFVTATQNPVDTLAEIQKVLGESSK